MRGCEVGCPLLWAVQLATKAHLESEAELELECFVWASTAVLASGLAGQVEEQGSKLEALSALLCKARQTQLHALGLSTCDKA